MIKFLETLTPTGISSICLLIVALVYRKPIGMAIEKLVNLTFRRRDIEMVYNASGAKEAVDEVSVIPTKVEETEDGQRDAASTSNGEQALVEAEETPTFMKLLEAFNDNNLDKANTIFANLQEESKDELERAQNRGYFLYKSYIMGQKDAILKLEELAKGDDAKDVFYQWTARAYEQVKHFSKAVKNYELAARYGRDDAVSAVNIVLAAEALYASGRKAEAVGRLEKEIYGETNEEVLVILYRGIANIYRQEDNHFLRAIALDKAVSYEPNNTQILFDTAYSYGQSSHSGLAILHYESLLDLKPNSDWARNNLGVELDKNKLHIEAVESYKKASKSGNTLATANLTYKLIDVGFKDEAIAFLDEANRQTDVHENIAYAKGHLVTTERKEGEAKQVIIKRSKASQEFFRDFAQAYFGRCSNLIIEGTWNMSSVGEISIEQNGSDIKAVWQKGETKFTLSGVLHNRGIIGSIRKTEGYFNSSESFDMYISEDKATLTMLKNNEVLIGAKLSQSEIENS